MEQTHNIEKLFRDKLYQRNFELNTKHWDSAQKMIGAQDGKNLYWSGSKIWLSLISALFILSGIIGYLLLNNGKDNNQPAIENSLAGATDSNTNAVQKKAEPDKIQEPESSLQNAIRNDEMQAIHKQAEQKTGTSEKVAKQQKQLNKKTTPNNSKNLTEGVKDEKNQSQTINNKQQATKDSGNVNAGNESQHSNDNQSEPEIFILNKDVITINEDKKLEGKPLKSKKAKTRHEKLSNQKQTINGPNLEVMIDTSEELTTEENLLSDETDIEPVSETTAVSPLLALQKKNDDVQQNESIEEQPITGTLQPEPDLQQPEHDIILQPEKIPLKDRLNWLRHISVGFLGGANISSGLKNTDTSYAGISARPIGGLRISYQINEQVHLESGLFYNYRTGLSSQMTTLVSKDMSNNVNHLSTSKTLSLHYWDLPMQFTYKYGKHSFMLGIQYSHLFNTYQHTINTTDENGNVSVENSSKQWNKNDGRFSAFDMAGIFGYEYEISERIKFCARYNRGLFDITDDTFFGNSVKDINKQFRLMLEYRLWKY